MPKKTVSEEMYGVERTQQAVTDMEKTLAELIETRERIWEAQGEIIDTLKENIKAAKKAQKEAEKETVRVVKRLAKLEGAE